MQFAFQCVFTFVASSSYVGALVPVQWLSKILTYVICIDVFSQNDLIIFIFNMICGDDFAMRTSEICTCRKLTESLVNDQASLTNAINIMTYLCGKFLKAYS